MTTNEEVASDTPPAVLVLSCLELKGLSLCMSDPATRPGVYIAMSTDQTIFPCQVYVLNF